MSFLNIRSEGAIIVLTMNEPAMRNPLSGNSAAEELVQACAQISADASVRAVVLTGTDPAFSSGGSLKVMREDWKDRKAGTTVRQQLRHGVLRIGEAFQALEVPVVAAVNGPAIGGGCDLACVCDLRIASERAVFAANFVKLGIVPAMGGAWLLTRLLGPTRAAQLCLTGEAIKADRALAWGLVNEVVPHEALMPAALALAGRIAANSGPALRMTKALLRAADRTDFKTYLDMAAGLQALSLQSDEHEAAVHQFEDRTRAPKETQ